MADPHRTDTSRAVDAVSDSDRDAKVEQLLLDGLDCYFAAQYEQAIHVWSRALFFDRGHSRARAYIDRARRAIAERQRESDELVESGVAALSRGDRGEARRLLSDALDRGVVSDEARTALGRLDQLDTAAAAAGGARSAEPSRRNIRPPLFRYRTRSASRSGLLLAAAAGTAACVWLAASADRIWQPSAGDVLVAPAAAPPTLDAVPDLPLRAETALTRARMLAAGGRLHDAMTALDLVRPTDPQKSEADRLRADLQRRLIALTLPDDVVPADREAGDAVP
jgi:hypothetical protein